ncbi:MAG: biotin transporter BioY [Lachnospiraceae bacterium]|nr:biotin transporter BioY [Lachnospiraceae bacterium]
MQKTTSGTLSPTQIQSMMQIALLTAVCCILSPLSVPIGPIPVSLSLFAVYLTVYLLGTKKAFASVLLYILIGLVGMPVFSGYAGGPAKLFGPTGGYIFGYLTLVLISGFFIDRFPARKWMLQIGGMLLGLLSCYFLGTVWFMLLSGMSLGESLALCVYPFVAFDAAKILSAYFVGNTIKHAVRFVSTH